MQIWPFFQVDAFTSTLFSGNPAAIVLLPENSAWPADALLVKIAAENNLSETAYLRFSDHAWHIRWFTPVVEVDLCGHATLASAFLLIDILEKATDSIVFHTQSAGKLFISKQSGQLSMNFPARSPDLIVEPAEVLKLRQALNLQDEQLLEIKHNRSNYFVVLKDTDTVTNLRPDFEELATLALQSCIVTASVNEKNNSIYHDCDFVSRFFAPAKGINEDPVTGSAHCALIPYWANRLQRSKLTARQIGIRGGTLRCEYLSKKQVLIGGECRLYLRGEIEVA